MSHLVSTIGFLFVCYSVGTTVVVLVASLFVHRSDDMVFIFVFVPMAVLIGIFSFIAHVGHAVDRGSGSGAGAEEFPPLQVEKGGEDPSLRERPAEPPPHSNLRTLLIALAVFWLPIGCILAALYMGVLALLGLR